MLSNNNIPQFFRSSCWKKRNECFVIFDVVLIKFLELLLTDLSADALEVPIITV